MIRTLHSIALVLSLSYGCGGDPVSLKQAVIDRGKLICREAFRCRETYSRDIPFSVFFDSDERACNARFAELAMKYEAAEKRGTLSYSEDKYQICTNHGAQFFPVQSCDVFWTATDSSPAPECDTEITGYVADGGVCVLDAECSVAVSWCNGNKCEPALPTRSALAKFSAMLR